MIWWMKQVLLFLELLHQGYVLQQRHYGKRLQNYQKLKFVNQEVFWPVKLSAVCKLVLFMDK